MKIAQIPHRFRLRTNFKVYKFHKNLFFLFPKIFEYVVIELKIAIILTILFNVKVGQ